VKSVRPVVSIEEAWSSSSGQAADAIIKHLDGLYRFALRLTGNADDAQELAQETFLRTWQRKETITLNVRAWMFQTLYHTFISSRRQRTREEVSGDVDSDSGILEYSGPSFPALIAREDVRNAIAALPQELRTVVWLSDAEEFRLREIAQILDCPIGTVASRLWRARLELRRFLSAYGPLGEKQP
jgi:RNA polymerase sigma-70 factor (ECF subfamily)